MLRRFRLPKEARRLEPRPLYPTIDGLPHPVTPVCMAEIDSNRLKNSRGKLAGRNGPFRQIS